MDSEALKCTCGFELRVLRSALISKKNVRKNGRSPFVLKSRIWDMWLTRSLCSYYECVLEFLIFFPLGKIRIFSSAPPIIFFIGPLDPHRERERVAEDATTQTVQSLVRPHQLSGIAQFTRVLLRATINLKLADFDISTVAHHTLLVILENCEWSWNRNVK